MAAIPCGKTRPRTNPYEVWVAGDWTWKVLKKYQADDNKPFARAFCEVDSPMCHGVPDLGDVFIADYKKYARLVEVNP